MASSGKKSESAKGLIQVYTGDGKGKTTAALGLALRASGQKRKVIIIQFVKGDPTCGEHLLAAKYHPFEIVQFNTGDSFVQTLSFAEKTLIEGNYDVVILDEIFIAVSKGLITASQVIDLMSKKPEKVELILTGRGAPQPIIRQADLVTEMVAIKHPFTRGITARKGIEY